MTKAYTVLSDLWHQGTLYLENEVIHLTDAAAKYLAHALRALEGDVAAKAEEAKAEIEADVAAARERVSAALSVKKAQKPEVSGTGQAAPNGDPA